jgi:hypothetical protein
MGSGRRSPHFRPLDCDRPWHNLEIGLVATRCVAANTVTTGFVEPITKARPDLLVLARHARPQRAATRRASARGGAMAGGLLRAPGRSSAGRTVPTSLSEQRLPLSCCALRFGEHVDDIVLGDRQLGEGQARLPIGPAALCGRCREPRRGCICRLRVYPVLPGPTSHGANEPVISPQSPLTVWHLHTPTGCQADRLTSEPMAATMAVIHPPDFLLPASPPSLG